MILDSKNNLHEIDFDQVELDSFWNTGEKQEHLMHRIHAYPAKFPAFIATKSIEYAKQDYPALHRIADIFCGCGTVAFESKINAIDFWGCDINPVAVLIAKVKSKGKYQTSRLKRYYELIIQSFDTIADDMFVPYCKANPRFRYWYDETHYEDLAKLKKAIEKVTSEKSDYRLFYYCAFSNILKPTSRWLTKSIKPQIDPEKTIPDVLSTFKTQVATMIHACQDVPIQQMGHTDVVQMNFLDKQMRIPKVDMIVTSPPYVTSYEYADLHQLSSLWLEYASDYRDLRKGSIGSLTQNYPFKEKIKLLNSTGKEIVEKLLKNIPEKARDVAKYYIDMQTVAKRAYTILRKKGLAVFVIGNTEYKGVRIDNAKHLTESLFDAGFSEVKVTKRKISKKNLTPFRDERGHFSSDGNGRKVYSEEFILIGRKCHG